MDYVTFTIIVDDIVYPDGHTAMACLGGGGTQTAFGMKLWASDQDRVGLAARVGSDFPSSCRAWLQDMEIDETGILLWPYPTLRAWQLLEEDGKRSQVWRVDVGEEVWPMLRPSVKDLPLEYRNATAYHACVHPSGLDVNFIQDLRSSGAIAVSIEPYTHAEDIVTRSELQALVSGGHIFSPNEKEAVSLVGPGTPLELIDRLVELGAEVVSLRRGHLGCIVHRADTRETWDVPAFHSVYGAFLEISADKELSQKKSSVQVDSFGVKGVVDPTGCGNSFCGGFVTGWVKARDLLTAALWGSVSASFSDVLNPYSKSFLMLGFSWLSARRCARPTFSATVCGLCQLLSSLGFLPETHMAFIITVMLSSSVTLVSWFFCPKMHMADFS